MRGRYRWALLAALLLPTILPAQEVARRTVSARLDAILDAPEYDNGRWGVLVVDAKTGQTVYERNARQKFIPASTMKLFFCAPALGILGPDYKFETPVYRTGDVTDGKLRGDLVLVASGDPTMGGRNLPDGKMAYTDDDHTYANSVDARSILTTTDPLTGLKDLAKQVKASGVRQVQGDVMIDDRLFATTRGNGSGPAILSPIVINDNVIDVVVRPGDRLGGLARAAIRPNTTYVEWDNQVTTAPEGTRTQVEVVSTGSRRFTVRGQIAAGSRSVVRIHPIDDPAGFARWLFMECLIREGITFPADATNRRLPDPASYTESNRVANFTSPPFSELLKVTLKTSSNIYANTMPLIVAASKGKRTFAEGLESERDWLKEIGVAVDEIDMATASGGTRNDRLTPRATVQLLRALAKRPEYPIFMEGLPVLGVDGTLADALPPRSPARGKVLGKTGTFFVPESRGRSAMLYCKALAGVMTTASGRDLVFAIFVNDVPIPRGVTSEREQRVIGRMCEILYEGVK